MAVEVREVGVCRCIMGEVDKKIIGSMIIDVKYNFEVFNF